MGHETDGPQGRTDLRIGLVAGEASGDQLGAGLVRALTDAVPGLRCEGVAGPLMQAAGCEAWEDAEALAVMGLVEPLKEIPRLLRLRRRLIRRWTANPPDVFVGIDAPDFNLGLEIELKKRGIATVQYVSPSVWAWRQRRVRKISRATDKVLCLLPFEKAFYDSRGIAAEFVGHPLADNIPRDLTAEDSRRTLGIEASSVIAVLPGSRASEVRRLAPVFVATARKILAQRPQVVFVAPMASARLRPLFERELRRAGVTDRFMLVDRNAQLVMASADVVLLASGTAALEAALLQRPVVAAYRLAPLTYWLAKGLRLVKVPYFTLPNLLTPEPLVPEFLQGAATAEALCESVLDLLDSPDRRRAIAREFAKLRDQLAQGADRLAANAVLGLARDRDATGMP